MKSKGIEEEIKLGDLIILSQSAHIYDDSWEWCERVVRKYLPQYTYHLFELDKRGNFIISITEEEIVVEHTSPTNEHIGEYRGKTGFEVMRKIIADNVISLPAHAMDLGMELMKAELAIKYGIVYIQDQPLASLTEEISIVEKLRESVKEMEKITTIKKPIIKPGIKQSIDDKKIYSSLLRKIRLDSYSYYL